MGSIDLDLRIAAQPDDVTCGATCLHALYHFYGHDVPLARIVAETPQLVSGGTLVVLLANHALGLGYRATIYSYNLQIFDPTWYELPPAELIHRLQEQLRWKPDRHHLIEASKGYIRFLELGGEVRFADLTAALLREQLSRGLPVLTGLSSTYLYRTSREYGPRCDHDDIRGVPAGHFVLITGWDDDQQRFMVADPYSDNPLARGQTYAVEPARLIAAILLGIVTYDANLLIIEEAAPPS